MSDKALVEILPLSEDTLNDAISLLNKIFISKEDRKIFPLSLRESLTEANSKKTYWVAVEFDRRVVGITGLYNYHRDRKTAWHGWFGVHPAYRNRGIGSALLDYAIIEAGRRGFRILKLYSSNDRNEKDSHRLYGKFGFMQSAMDADRDRVYFIKELTGGSTKRRRQVKMREIEIEWKGPFDVEKVINELADEGPPPDYDGDDYGLYQIYGEHILCGKNTLLYIGKATRQTFSSRISQHKKWWLDGESEVQIYIGRIYDRDKHSEKDNWASWEDDVDTAEKILIYKYSPNYNSREVANPPEPTSHVRLIHGGEKNRLEAQENAPEDF